MQANKIFCFCERIYNKPGALWRLLLNVEPQHGHMGGGHIDAGVPGSWAVVDDFGTLVCVEGWK